MTIGIYHDADCDGLACAAILQHHIPDICLIPWDYRYKEDNIFGLVSFWQPTQIYICDVSLSMEGMLALGKIAPVVWIDHHEGVYKEIALNLDPVDNIKVVYGPVVSACELTWNYFNDIDPPQWLHALGCYDTWRKNELDWHEVVLPYQMYFRLNFTVDHFLNAFSGEQSVFEQGKLLARYEMGLLRNLLPLVRMEGREAVINTSHNPSLLTDLVWEKYPDADILVAFHQLADHRWKFSLRSPKNGANCQEYAKRFGGNGHRHAAGYIAKGLK